VKKNAKIPGELVTSVTGEELLISVGIQLVMWAHDIAFTDAAFGQAWAVETSDRMACCSELLKAFFDKLPTDIREMMIDLPESMLGEVAINPHYVPDAEKPSPKGKGDSDEAAGGDSSIRDFPF